DIGARGFLLTGDQSLLQPFRESGAQVGREFDALSRLVADNPPQVKQVQAMRTASDQWLVHAEEMIGRRQRGEDYQSIPVNARDQELTDGVRREFAGFMGIERALRQERITALQRLNENVQKFRWLVLLVLGLALGLYFRRQLAAVVRIYETALTTAKQKTDALQVSEASLREAEGKLRQYADDLEKTVAQRTAKLQETVEELEAYSYSISHDLRAPLRAMEGYAKVLLEDFQQKVGTDGMVYLDRIIKAAYRMDKLIQDILSYSRVTRTEIKSEPVDLENLVRDIIQQYPGLSSLNGEIKIEGPLPRVLAPEALLTQCIANLLNNAVKFAADGVPVCVRVRAETFDADVRLWVEDNGIGIAPEYKTRIFGVFERIPGERAREGMGIGLAIVHKAVERMGGTVGVESEPGKGSRFWILLPGRKLPNTYKGGGAEV
ncbi:MAG TPA: ATP-binding protein, partial [Verrucomicrobiae bacterium]|nr:ATP-binding protein [Verrucomicrobiae bacterium]